MAVAKQNRWGSGPTECPMLDTVFYTPDVINVPGSISSGIRYFRDTLRDLARRPLRLEKEERLGSIQRRDEEHQATFSPRMPGCPSHSRNSSLVR